jgi:hypothetical protein
VRWLGMTRDTGVQVRDDRRLRLPSVPLYLGFIGTGVGVALPGASLPAMLLRWRMTDAQGGRLFLFAWIGSSVGALIVQGSLRRTLFTGCAAIAAGALGLGFGSGAAVQAEAWMLLYGAGLGLAMTSISLIQQASSGERSGPELIRLNLLWALGAFVCPTLAEHALAVGDLRPLLVGLALTFVGLGLWCAVVRAPEEIRTETKTLRGWTALARVPLPLIVMTMLITGIEASAGGWLATYARRNGEGWTPAQPAVLVCGSTERWRRCGANKRRTDGDGCGRSCDLARGSERGDRRILPWIWNRSGVSPLIRLGTAACSRRSDILSCRIGLGVSAVADGCGVECAEFATDRASGTGLRKLSAAGAGTRLTVEPLGIADGMSTGEGASSSGRVEACALHAEPDLGIASEGLPDKAGAKIFCHEHPDAEVDA